MRNNSVLCLSRVNFVFNPSYIIFPWFNGSYNFECRKRYSMNNIIWTEKLTFYIKLRISRHENSTSLLGKQQVSYGKSKSYISSNEEGLKETNEGADMDFVCKSDSSDSYFYKRQIVLISFIYLINPLNY